MIRRFIVIFLLNLLAQAVALDHSVPDKRNLPVDISFLITDLKYNESQGVKICELQRAGYSTFSGYDFVQQSSDQIIEKFCQLMSEVHNSCWLFSTSVRKQKSVADKFLHYGWHLIGKESEEQKRELKQIASEPLLDPFTIVDYPAIIFAKHKTRTDLLRLKRNFPGAIILDAALNSYDWNKHLMSRLFLSNKVLEGGKPRWRVYPKGHSKDLVLRIKGDIPSDFLVIKPLKATMGRGVIIIAKEDLERTLKYIFSSSKSLLNGQDPSYAYWLREHSGCFIVEEFVPSDPVYVPHLGNQPYDGTMRVVFALIYDQGQIDVHFLGEYWKLPRKSLVEEGTLIEKLKSTHGAPYYCAVDEVTREKVRTQLREILTVLYKRVLGLEDLLQEAA